MTASLDGGVGGSSTIGLPEHRFTVDRAPVHEVELFASLWPPWSNSYAITPADTCLARLGSVQHTYELVVCDSKLNGMKTSIYNLLSPVGETTWESYCLSPTPASLGRALGGMQLIMAVFDYYDDANVKDRHRQVYADVMMELGEFGRAFGSPTMIKHWQIRWREFMIAHFLRVRTHTRLWLLDKLVGLDEVWHQAHAGCGSDEGWCAFCIHARELIKRHSDAIELYQRVDFDFTIFDYDI
ncbi:hypothetical protein C8A03DRAFT_19651 [Achaetomium macrosporum]|uniref:Uncharacterized protein n=1 Tax=Achaetomium macrosporum TaxID=79813 RepID=A0AAN7C111_9PEZI|nr:hypothetical protein C8A03DRAFT_19651 [Achaetomium macrosporum]